MEASPSPGDERRQEASTRTPKRTPRIRLACVRCSKRKIKCDGVVPSCSSCSKASVACIDVGRGRDKYPRAYIASLHDRISWLESTLTSHCPDIDLSGGPQVIQKGTVDGDSSSSATAHIPAAGGTSYQARDGAIDPVISGNAQQTSEESQSERIAHEIGMVSVTGGQDPRYVGPSSGYSFAKLVLATIGRRSAIHRQRTEHSTSAMLTDAFQVTPATLPTSMDYATHLSAAYWENVHCQYPFLHKPTHAKHMDHVYNSADPSPIALFQVYMVLAISGTILSRRHKIPIPAEGYCATAMTYFDQIHVEACLEGLQCLLLLQFYGMNNPSLGVNLWYLNYQCIANVLDLGLQRDVRASRNLSFLTQEMRTRIFWVVYSIDRKLATIMGRPIGLRDEACELRMPADVEDDALVTSDSATTPALLTTSNAMAFHLIKLAQINSEIKYIANSITHKTPAHCYPQIPDVSVWQRDVLARLSEWLTSIPRMSSTHTKLCEIKYHEVMMLLLRPSPAIRNPSEESLQLCHQSAIATIRGFEDLYRTDLLLYNWPTVHSVFLAGVSMLYCIWKVPAIAREAQLEVLSADLNCASKVLCALAEHWVDAKRGRDVLDELSHSTMRWIAKSQRTGMSASVPNMRRGTGDTAVPAAPHVQNQSIANTNGPSSNMASPPLYFWDVASNSEPWHTLFGNSGESSLDFELDSLMQGVFNDVQYDLDFGQNLPLDNSNVDTSILPGD